MQIPGDIYGPFKYSWNLVKILVVIAVFIVLYYIYDRFFHEKLMKLLNKAKVPSLRILYLRKLERLLADVMNNQINIRDAFFKLSGIIRSFIKLASGINVLSMSKKEVHNLGNRDISMLMEEYYPPEFSKYSKGDIIGSINRTMEVIKKWN